MHHNNTLFVARKYQQSCKALYLNRPLAGFSAPEDVDYLKWVSETKIRPLQPEAKKEQHEDLPSTQRTCPPDSIKKQNHPPPPCSGSSLSQESGVENPGYLRYDNRITGETQLTGCNCIRGTSTMWKDWFSLRAGCARIAANSLYTNMGLEHTLACALRKFI